MSLCPIQEICVAVSNLDSSVGVSIEGSGGLFMISRNHIFKETLHSCTLPM